MTTQPQVNLYNQDFNAWLYSTADKLKAKKFDELDLEHIIEEIEGLAIKNYRELFSRMKVLLAHLLKWQYQPTQKSGSWSGTIIEQRQELEDLLLMNPSLKNKAVECCKDDRLFRKALEIVKNDTSIKDKDLPTSNPYTLENMLDSEFYPNTMSD